ncbi:YeeE/YedE family protein [Sediminitomix flava]|uniref:Uncharacterized protein n=1 Tax=Sediminitomix flava TaxID=379075 RepID=A0A315Z696_SEDFL|nr:YeeE/YedE thiosulfate transporter family protein [Sediminitomix flava]PWJ39948.1 hypothetical protein BC781_10511 [Sediminitomix flava]
MDWITQPWPWYVAGPMIALTLFLMLFFGKEFGISGNLRTICTIAGGGKYAEFFRFDWKSQKWNLMFLLGNVLGGFLANQFLTPDQTISLSEKTISSLQELGFENIGASYLPEEIFSLSNAFSIKGFLILLIGGILVGFGTRYAGGCTSGHAISGLSNLQLPSLIAVIGFFIGGLIMTHFILPILF